MDGQIIIHDGIRVSGSSAPAIYMSAPDEAAAESAALLFALSGRDPGDYVNDSFRSRKAGVPFSLLGPVGAAPFAVNDLGGHPAIVSPGTATSRALVSPAGKFDGGFTVVAAVYLAAESIATGADTNFLTILDENNGHARVFNPIRYAGGAKAFRIDSFSGTAIATNTAGWYVITSDFAPVSPESSASATYRLGVNAMPSATVTTGNIDLPTVYQNPSFSLGYHTGSNGLRDCGIGDLYFHDESLCNSQGGLAYLSDLVTRLKAQYGIA